MKISGNFRAEIEMTQCRLGKLWVEPNMLNWALRTGEIRQWT